MMKSESVPGLPDGQTRIYLADSPFSNGHCEVIVQVPLGALAGGVVVVPVAQVR